MSDLTDVQKLMQGDIIREVKRNNLYRHFKHRPFTSNGTEIQKNSKSRGVGITRKNKEETKKAVKLAKSRRSTNLARKNKKFRPTGSKKRI